MKKKVVLSGNIYQEDLKYVKGSSELELVVLPRMEVVDINRLAQECRDADLLIFRLVGDKPQHFIEKCKTSNLLHVFESIKCPKVFWSQDSHHVHMYESSVESYFTRVYIAHKNYLDKFSDKAVWLPCCFTATSLPDLFRLQQVKLPLERDLISVFNMYHYSQRNSILYNICKICDQKNVKYMFGALNSSLPDLPYAGMLTGLKTSAVSLNIPFSDDLNIRNFETIAAGRALLAMQVPSHKDIDLDFSHTWFFKPDLSDFSEAFEAALADRAENDTWKCIPGKHMLIDRYLSIINNELKTDFYVDVPWDEDFTPLPLESSLIATTDKTVTVYDKMEIFARSVCYYLDQGLAKQARAVWEQGKYEPGIEREAAANRIVELLKDHGTVFSALGAISIFVLSGTPFTTQALSVLEDYESDMSIPLNRYVDQIDNLSGIVNFKLNQKIALAALQGVGIYQRPEQWWGIDFVLKQLLADKIDPVVLDIGAGSGIYAVQAKKLFPSSRVYAFEPDPEAFEKLKIISKKINFMALPFAVSSEPEERELYKCTANSNAPASMYPELLTDVYNCVPLPIKVGCVVLDKFIAESGFEQIDVLKLSVCGHELAALQGLEKTLAKGIIRALHIEYAPDSLYAGYTFKDLKKLLPGYSWFRLLCDGMVPVDSTSLVLQERAGLQHLLAIQDKI